MANIYVASSWRNKYQQDVVKLLREEGHDVYDFRNPKPGVNGFAWSEIDPDWLKWSPEKFAAALQHPVAKGGFKHDLDALEWCNACVLVLPSGMSAHLEAGWCSGRGKLTCVYAPELREPELMYKLFDQEYDDGDLSPFFPTINGVVEFLRNNT